MCKSILSPTITPKVNNFPTGLIYKIPKTNSYKLADTSGKLVGEINLLERFCKNSSFYNAEPYGRTLHIYSLAIKEEDWGKGWGSYLLDFAKKESYKRGCKGRCSLVAHYPGRPPHVFYKKNGFVTTNENTNLFLDECIKNNVKPTFLNAMDMFIPIKEYMMPKATQKEEPKGFLSKIFGKIKSLF